MARWLFATIVTTDLTVGEGRPPARIVPQDARRRFTETDMSLDEQVLLIVVVMNFIFSHVNLAQ